MEAGWGCPACDTRNGAGVRFCMGCGRAVLPKAVLAGPGTGEVIRTTVRLDIGRALLARFGPDARYAAEPQFVLSPDPDTGEWRVLPCPGTPNRTCYAGAPVGPEGAVLADGGVIELGPGKLQLRVGLEVA